ncbi:MAG: hypothetical protein ACOYM0_13090 [Bacteroidales bacterium]
MNNLDKLIQENRLQFDDTEPPDGHFERFSEKLGTWERMPSAPSRFGFVKVAAVIIVIITGSVMVFDLATRSIRDRFTASESGFGMTAEMTEAIQYYDARAMSQIKEVDKLANDPAEAGRINKEAMKEIEALDENTRDLQKSLAENPNCERLQAAVIQNQQMKEGIMNTIVSNLKKQ